MGCCIGEKHSNWCQNNPTGASYPPVYIDNDGNEYCIFHAPADCKFVTLYDERKGGEKPPLMDGADFNQLVFDRIQGVIDAGEDEERDEYGWDKWNPRCNFAGTIFFAEISFSKFNSIELGKYLPPINFSEVEFMQEVDFYKTQIIGIANFSKSRLKKNAGFSHTQFRDTAIFAQAQFRDTAYFTGAQFWDLADFSGAQFWAEAYFHNVQFRDPANFGGAQFWDETYFRNVQFRNLADFAHSQFKSIADFSGAQFCAEAYFNNVQFRNLARFSGVQFRDEADFSNVQFRNLANFFEAKFNKEVYFIHSQFRGESSFEKSIFKSKAFFCHAQFRGLSSFAKTYFLGIADFDHAQFRQEANFENSYITDICLTYAEARKKIFFNGASFEEASFSDMSFREPVYFDDVWFLGPASFENTVFYDFSNFENAEFHGETQFNLTNFKEWAYFRNVEFNDDTSFAGAISKETILIENAKLDNLLLQNTNIESFQFTECEWPRQKNGRRAIRDEIRAGEDGEEISITKLEEIYRRLKKVARANNDEMQASAWHYKEKEMLRKKLREENGPGFFERHAAQLCTCLPCDVDGMKEKCAELITATENLRTPFLRFINTAYWLVSGYGEEPMRALVWLLLLIFGAMLPAAFGPDVYDAAQKLDPDFLKSWMWYMPLMKVSGVRAGGWNYILKAVFNLGITLQATLFGFALRNKLRR